MFKVLCTVNRVIILAGKKIWRSFHRLFFVIAQTAQRAISIKFDSLMRLFFDFLKRGSFYVFVSE